MNIKFYLLSQEFAAGDTCTYVGGEGSGLVAHFGLDRMCFGHYCGEGVGGGVMAGMCAHIRVHVPWLCE